VGRAGLLVLCVVLTLGAKSDAPGDEIHKAVIKGNLNAVAALLKEHPDLLESKNNLGQTPLYEAVVHNQLEIAEMLLANGADVNARDGYMHTPLIQALWVYNHDKMMRLLLAKGAKVNLEDKWSLTALAYAAKQGQVEDAKILIANGANVNFESGETPLYMAVMGTHREMVELLLASGADANQRVRGLTPLDYAKQELYQTGKMSDPKIEALLKEYSGQGLDAISSARSDEIHKAVVKGDFNKVVALLNEHPDLLEIKNNLGQTPLIAAVNHNQVEIAELLLANGANVNARDPQKRTPLILALPVNNHDRMLRLLLAKGADVNLADSWSMTAVTYAAKQGQIEDAKILIANDANINFVSGESPLYLAVVGAHTEMVELLLASGADANYKVRGYTPLHYANSDPKIEALLKKYGGYK
jgi:ankyrin repeat protein